MCIGNLEHFQISTLPLFEDLWVFPSYLLFLSDNFWHSRQLSMSWLSHSQILPDSSTVFTFLSPLPQTPPLINLMIITMVISVH